MKRAPIDWNSIRPLNGGREKGFEELCAQLARAESPKGAEFVRKAPPDAGVECYAILPDHSEWAWQAKYIDSLGDSQWKQIDKSVRTAIEKHPRLRRYFVCAPVDRSDGRMAGRKSTMDRWNEHVVKWRSRANKNGSTVEFVFWGSHELLALLTRREHAGRVGFWFGAEAFDEAWFSARLAESRRTAGPRYTPELNVDLPIALEFEGFGRTSKFFTQQRMRARGLRRQWNAVRLAKTISVPAADEAITEISLKVDAVLSALAALCDAPAGPTPFGAISELACEAATAVRKFERLLQELEAELDDRAIHQSASPMDRRSAREYLQKRQSDAIRLDSELRAVSQSAKLAEAACAANLMVLSGIAGVGKTHLLCDVATQRVAAGRPTVLLMGQRFRSHDEPWRQALQQLDLPGLSAEDFIGALESAAQAANARALIIVDALNEGSGRAIWPSHLEAFLAQCERSSWIGVVLAVRSTYESTIVPAEVLRRATRLVHDGFRGHEYNAAREFFLHYQLELPSAPLMTPEFQNPLFLKTLCIGLRGAAWRRVPRGLHGITTSFNLYLDAVNKNLSGQLGYDPREELVRRALDGLASELAKSNRSWVGVPRAKQIVDACLPGRDYERSLYRGLVAEGVLIEEFVWRSGEPNQDVVLFSYERLSDHLIAKWLLDRHLNDREPQEAFAAGGALAFRRSGPDSFSLGVVEALCIQVPERTGKELLELAPDYADSWEIEKAFLHSIIWRSHGALSDVTREWLCDRSVELRDVLDVLLTVSTVPEHPMNAEFLDGRLRKFALADRDARWSVYLHHAWDSRGPVDRLVDWASAQSPEMAIDDEVVELSALVLAWMLSSSNRYLRDRSTTALVSLLSGRTGAIKRLVERMHSVDDPYIVERLYAVAYGVAMRSCDPTEIGELALCVYKRVFESGSPVPHILLRDYARGVIERARYLGSNINVLIQLCRPPYASRWPGIPSVDEVKSLLPKRNAESDVRDDKIWARNRIAWSVMDDDFARYVIGTNSSSVHRSWLELPIDGPPFTPPPALDQKLEPWLESLTADEMQAWRRYGVDVRMELLRVFEAGLVFPDETTEHDSLDGDQPLIQDHGPQIAIPGLDSDGRGTARARLDAELTPKRREELDVILDWERTARPLRTPPGLELRKIQRYVLWRVFDLGWTGERFGDFDGGVIGYTGREASKAERIGKKYQWIAYHEMLAYVADKFRYQESLGGSTVQAYEGPWQESLRDIDPSCTQRSQPGGPSWGPHSPSWWAPTRFDNWGDPHSPDSWASRQDDLPRLEDLLRVTDPSDGSRWVSGYGSFYWMQPTPPDLEPSDAEQRQLWYSCTAYLIKSRDVEAFLKWSGGVDFWGRWMPQPATIYAMFLGEHAWAPASKYFDEMDGGNGWILPERECPVEVRSVCVENLHEQSGFNCALDESFTLHLPVTQLVSGMGMHWSGVGADFIDASGELVAQDPSARDRGPSALLLREDALRQYLERESLTICWTILGERRVMGAGSGPGVGYSSLRMSGAYALVESGLRGFVKGMVDRTGARSSMDDINVLRSGY